MAKVCGKWRIYLGIGLSAWETAIICGKWPRTFEMSQICGEMT